MAEGKVWKRLGELSLLEQPFTKDDIVLVQDFVKQILAAIGENIKVRHFVWFTLRDTSQSETTIPTEGETRHGNVIFVISMCIQGSTRLI